MTRLQFWRKVGFWVVFRTIYGLVGVFFWLSPNIFWVSKILMARGFNLSSVEVIREKMKSTFLMMTALLYLASAYLQLKAIYSVCT